MKNHPRDFLPYRVPQAPALTTPGEGLAVAHVSEQARPLHNSLGRVVRAWALVWAPSETQRAAQPCEEPSPPSAEAVSFHDLSDLIRFGDTKLLGIG